MCIAGDYCRESFGRPCTAASARVGLLWASCGIESPCISYVAINVVFVSQRYRVYVFGPKLNLSDSFHAGNVEARVRRTMFGGTSIAPVDHSPNTSGHHPCQVLYLTPQPVRLRRLHNYLIHGNRQTSAQAHFLSRSWSLLTYAADNWASQQDAFLSRPAD